MSRKLRVGIDIDDVCVNLVETVLQCYNEGLDSFYSPMDKAMDVVYPLLNHEARKKLGYLEKEDVESWDILSYIAPRFQDLLSFYLMDDGSTVFEKLDYEGDKKTTLAGVKSVFEEYDVCFITDTPISVAAVKIPRFLELFPFVPQEKVILCKDKWRINVDVLVDDNPYNIHNFIANDASVKNQAIVMHQSWNYHEGLSPRVLLANNWDDIKRLLKEINEEFTKEGILDV